MSESQEKPYYENAAVRERIIEFLGGTSLEEASCVFLSRCDQEDYNRIEVRIPDELYKYLDQNSDLARSLWDHRALIVHLDIEYMNFDFPAVTDDRPVCFEDNIFLRDLRQRFN